MHIPISWMFYGTRNGLGYQVQSGEDIDHQVVSSIYDHGNYTEVFERDMIEAEQELIIASPRIRRSKVDRMLSLLKSRQEAGVKVTVITLDPDFTEFGDSADIQAMIADMQQAGISVLLTTSENEHYAVIDKRLVWHGGMNLLGREDVWDNLIRVESVQAATELLEMSYQSIIKNH